VAPRLGELALRALADNAPDFIGFARAIDLPGAPPPARVRARRLAGRGRSTQRVQEKLRREPVEDFRIDFEDGYGVRSDEEEDGHVVAAAREVAKAKAEGILPPFIGIRVKPFTEEHHLRSLRTLDGFLTALLEATGGNLPQNYVTTLPQSANSRTGIGVRRRAGEIGIAAGILENSLLFEIMIEQTQAVIGRMDGWRFRADRRRPRPMYRRPPGDLRLHRELRHHRGAPAHGPTRRATSPST